MLSDADILKAVETGRITLSPFRRECVQPSSVDLHLSNTFLVFDVTNHHIIDVKAPVDGLMKKVVIEGDQAFILHPGEFALGMTEEEIGFGADVAGRLEGKSSIGRLGVIIHTTAGFIDAGNCLKPTLELCNLGRLPVKLYAGMPIAQMSFVALSSPCQRPYGSAGLNSKYYRDQEPKASQMWKNFAHATSDVAG
jgi:dCTP deaminase